MTKNRTIDQQIADARQAHAELMLRTENLLLARRPIDHDLQAEVMNVEIDIHHLEQLRDAGAESAYDQIPFEPEDLEIRHAA